MDKNQIWGIGLMGLIVVVYFIFFRPQEPIPQQATKADTTQVAEKAESTAPDTGSRTATLSTDSTKTDSNQVAVPAVEETPEQLFKIETDSIIAEFSSKTGGIQTLTLKGHTTYEEEKVVLFDKKSAAYKMFSGEDAILGSGDFTTDLTGDKTVSGTDTLELAFSSTVNGKKVTHQYRIPGAGYEIFHDIQVSGASRKAEGIDIDWKYDLKKTEEGLKYSQRYSWIYLLTQEGSLDDYLDGGSDQETVEESAQWIAMKQRFFNAGIISRGQPLNKITVSSLVDPEDPEYVKHFKTKMTLPATSVNGTQTASLHYYYGPNDYYIMRDMDVESYHRNAYMGWRIFAFVNRWFVLPVFSFLEGFIGSYGVIIFILVILVKLLLFPIAYRSYKSMAKMRILKPEIDKIKEKHGGDMQKSQPETMKLYQQAGVNPLSGCIPIVLQMPVLLALFNFFPSCINLRHESFLWAHDLSTYDDVISWAGYVWPIGNHISLFTLLMTVSTIAYTYINNQSNAQAQGPVKYVSYLMPVIFFFVLNDFSSGLTFYYFVSNLITISQQLIAQRFIDKDKIAKVMEENRKNAQSEGSGNSKKSRFQQRLQEQLKASQEARNKK